MLRLVAEIGEAIGILSVLAEENAVSLRLRRKNRIRTVQGSLAIEGNTLSPYLTPAKITLVIPA